MLNVFESGKIKEIEKLVIKQRMDSLSWNRTHTAKSLGIGIRTLQRKLKRYDLLVLEPAELKAKNQALEVADAASPA